MLETFGPMLTSVGEVLLGLVLVHDIWYGSSSVEGVDVATKVLGRQRPRG